MGRIELNKSGEGTNSFPSLPCRVLPQDSRMGTSIAGPICQWHPRESLSLDVDRCPLPAMGPMSLELASILELEAPASGYFHPGYSIEA